MYMKMKNFYSVLCHNIRDSFNAVIGSYECCILALQIPENEETKHVCNVDEDCYWDNETYNEA